MKVLSNKKYSHLISWTESGEAFMIHKPKKFASEVLPKEFKQAKHASFTRKLHRWGFLRHHGGEEEGAFFHKDFQRGRLDLAEKMSCYGDKQAPEQKTQPEPAFPSAESTATVKSMAVRQPASKPCCVPPPRQHGSVPLPSPPHTPPGASDLQLRNPVDVGAVSAPTFRQPSSTTALATGLPDVDTSTLMDFKRQQELSLPSPPRLPPDVSDLHLRQARDVGAALATGLSDVDADTLMDFQRQQQLSLHSPTRLLSDALDLHLRQARDVGAFDAPPIYRQPSGTSALATGFCDVDINTLMAFQQQQQQQQQQQRASPIEDLNALIQKELSRRLLQERIDAANANLTSLRQREQEEVQRLAGLNALQQAQLLTQPSPSIPAWNHQPTSSLSLDEAVLALAARNLHSDERKSQDEISHAERCSLLQSYIEATKTT